MSLVREQQPPITAEKLDQPAWLSEPRSPSTCAGHLRRLGEHHTTALPLDDGAAARRRPARPAVARRPGGAGAVTLTFEVTLDRRIGPWPTSANALYRGDGRNRSRRPEVTGWQECVTELAVGALLQLPRPDRLRLEAAAEYAVRLLWRVRRKEWKTDVDNPVKSTVDAVFLALGRDDRDLGSLLTEREWVDGRQALVVTLGERGGAG